MMVFPIACKDTDILVSRADKAMYYSKRHGRGQLIIDSPVIDEDLKEENND
jgi:predicted signal transduction protein with EAL and GGDEF domain